VTELNRFANNPEMCRKLRDYRETARRASEMRFTADRWFKELFVSINDGTGVLGGACNGCLTPEYRDENDIPLLRSLLSQLQ
jgi:hypothetical protein